MKYFIYKAIRDAMSQEKSYWQVWVYDSRAEGGLRLFEPSHHTKQRAHSLADLLNHEIREFVTYNNGDVSVLQPLGQPSSEAVHPGVPISEDQHAGLWAKICKFLSSVFKSASSDS